MRKKYYLRGLGIGILVTAVILSVSSGNRSTKMTDEAIKERAKELGMIENTTLVKPDDRDNALEDSKQDGPEDDKETDGNGAGNAEDSNIDETAGNNSGASDDAETGDVDNKDDTNAGDDGQPAGTDDKDDIGTSDEPVSGSGAENADEAEYVTITINRGDSSYKAALLLKEAGLIENARDFDAFLSKHGYDKRIRVGEHKVKKNATYEEMAEAIASKKK